MWLPGRTARTATWRRAFAEPQDMLEELADDALEEEEEGAAKSFDLDRE